MLKCYMRILMEKLSNNYWESHLDKKEGLREALTMGFKMGMLMEKWVSE